MTGVSQNGYPISDRARAIHANLPVVDGHNDLPWKLHVEADGDFERADPGGDLPRYQTDIPRLLAGGVGAQLWSVYVPTDIPEPHARTMAQIELVTRMTKRDTRLAFARTGSEARAIRDSGRIASLIGAEGGACIENSIGKLEDLADRGVRYLTLTHSDTLDWADSATDEPRHGGLTSFGVDVVREMNRLGLLVDISHVSTATMRAALDASSAPIIASHSGASAIADHPRNIPDDVLREVGARGGVIMVVFFPGFLVPSTAAAMNTMFDTYRDVREQLDGDEAAISAEMDKRTAEMHLDRGSVVDVVRHIEHIASVAGVDAVGLGSDFDGMFMTPAGLSDVSCYPAITDELLRRGWAEENLLKVLGENSLRVLDTEPVAV